MRNTLIVFLVALFLGFRDKSLAQTNPNIGVKSVPHIADKKLMQRDSLAILLQKMNTTSLDCKAEAYWKIIKRGKSAIPSLINNLTDTTPTNVYDSCKKGKLNVGEVCYFALEEIAEFPAFTVTHIQFDVIKENGCWSFFDYLFDNKNKKEYQRMVREFYAKNKFVYTKFDKKNLNTCRAQYGIYGAYRMKM
ncbi:MAG TPA: hypothetical protein VFO93_17180 [Hymenobacter sp.]|nr:hypothetical protein [Hymenobacter sp.]